MKVTVTHPAEKTRTSTVAAMKTMNDSTGMPLYREQESGDGDNYYAYVCYERF